MKLIVAGSRDFTDYEFLKSKLDFLLQNKHAEIVSGTARGADKLGERYAEEKGLPIKQFEADWNGLGKRAGWVRNKAMAEYATHCVVFIKDNSPGSKMMIDLAKGYKLELRVYKV
jgi:hypothetical protein